jgi:hypothetical protein
MTVPWQPPQQPPQQLLWLWRCLPKKWCLLPWQSPEQPVQAE